MPSRAPRWSKAAALVLCNLAGLFAVDRLFGHFFPAYAPFMRPGIYRTNDRGYFDEVTGPDGKPFYKIIHSRERNRAYEGVKLDKRALQVIAIGDSFTFGQGVRLQDTYVKRLERVSAKRRIYGINLGDSGADVDGVLAELRGGIDRYKPGLVVYGYVLNDPNIDPAAPIAGLDGAGGKGADNIRWDLINLRTPAMLRMRGGLARWAGRHSRIVDYFLATAEKRRVSANTIQYYLDIHDPEKNPRGLAATFAKISLMKKMAERKGSRFVVMIFPIFFHVESDYPLLKAHRFLTSKLSELGIDSIDLQPAYAGFKTEELWVAPSDQHPNDIAQRVAADQLERWMRTRTRLLE